MSHGSCFYCCVAVQLYGADALLTDQVVSELCKYHPASEIWKGTMATGARYMYLPFRALKCRSSRTVAAVSLALTFDYTCTVLDLEGVQEPFGSQLLMKSP